MFSESDKKIKLNNSEIIKSNKGYDNYLYNNTENNINDKTINGTTICDLSALKTTTTTATTETALKTKPPTTINNRKLFKEINEKTDLRKFKNEKILSYIDLFRYATTYELFLTLFGIIFASLTSFGLPFSVIIYGEFSTLLVDRSVRIGTSTETFLVALFGGGRILTNGTVEENRIALLEDSWAYGIGSIVGAAMQFILGLISIDLINYSALKQINRIRKLFLRAVLRQDMSWYDTNTTNNFAVRITDDLDKIKEGIGEKLSIFIYLMMSFIISVAFSLFYGWKLTLAVLSCAPIIIIATALVAKMQSSLAEKELQSYASAGSVADEVFSSIRTVVAFEGEDKEAQRYKSRLRPAEITGQRKGLFSGIGGGIMWFIIYCSYALAFWYGVKLILQDRTLVDKEYTPAVLVIVLFGVLAGAQNLGLTSPHLEAFATARGAASAVFSVIERQPIIDSFGECGLCPKMMVGDIDFENIQFRYPARSDVKVLQGLNLSIKSGQTVALVGSSGCGKSTCLQLIQRLYDPLHGCVKIDGIKVTELNTRWLRSHIGVVGQEPVLFATTIAENIRYGFPDATHEEIENSAKIANCHDFIVKLPNGYDTMVGERGAQLSGGQKQRIAIARALVRNPRILLLDEATSALDPQSEKKVQKALEKASKGRTTLVVSHRLSTITNADEIVYIDKGVIVEAGTHSKLMEINGFYKHLVDATNSTSNENIGDLNKLKNTRNVIKKPETMSKSIVNEKFEESSSEDEEEEQDNVSNDDIVEEDRIYSVSPFRLIKMNSKEWPYIVIGCIAAMAVGCSFPAFAIIFGEFYGILSIQDPEEVYKESLVFSILFIVLGIVTGLGTFLQTYLFNIAGVRLTSRLRQMTFKAILRQEMGWFDEPKNAVGALCARLSGDCASVQGATGSRIGSILQAASTLVFGTAISLYYSWKLTAVSILSVPLVLAAVFFESRYMETSNIEEKEAMESTTKIAVEAISNIKTVASLGQEPHVLERYLNEMKSVENACRRKVRFRGTVFSLGQTAPFFGYGLALFYGGIMVANEGLEYKNVIKVSEALIFGAWMLGQALAYAPNVNSAIISAGRIMRILDRKSKMTDLVQNSSDKEIFSCNGNVHYSDIEFRYPTRPGVQVLQGLNLDVLRGQTVALVGPSGCGKSTCIQLLLRYYDPDRGFVKLDEEKTTDLPLNQLRSQLGLVSQEPVLFDRSIADNIAYGDNARQIPMAELIEAAKMSNIHEFIISLPQGYETNVGSKASQLSGGQKQRVAIARALVRNPKILLLDEATSALDTQSEKVVQEALDFARKGRTCIVIAHRLTTIQNMDTICVLQDGIITEKGTHEELMAIGKFYANLYSMQQVR